MSYAFGPGPMTPAVKAIIYTNIGAFVLTLLARGMMIGLFGLSPQALLERGHVWQLGTYLFIHDPNNLFHILFNMLAVWMFGVDLERRWGTQAFTKYYFVTGVGAGLCVLVAALLPFEADARSYYGVTIGASGAVYGLLLAWAVVFPTRTIIFVIFPMTARVFAIIMGAIAFFSAVGGTGGPVSNLAHLGGLVIGWIYLKGPKNLRLEMQYRLTRWRMERMRRRFNLHRGGRDDWEDRLH
jgi:rhomboid family protein